MWISLRTICYLSMTQTLSCGCGPNDQLKNTNQIWICAVAVKHRSDRGCLKDLNIKSVCVCVRARCGCRRFRGCVQQIYIVYSAVAFHLPTKNNALISYCDAVKAVFFVATRLPHIVESLENPKVSIVDLETIRYQQIDMVDMSNELTILDFMINILDKKCVA